LDKVNIGKIGFMRGGRDVDKKAKILKRKSKLKK
jgi:hypothetical protein